MQSSAKPSDLTLDPGLKDINSMMQHALQVLTTGDFQSQWDVSKQFVELGPQVIKPLTEVVQDTSLDWEARWFAIRTLGAFKQPQVIALLAQVMAHETDEELSGLAASTLAAMGEEAITTLTNLLSLQAQRKLAVKALAQIRKSPVIAPLLSVVQDPDPDIRYLAVEALSSFHDPQVTPVLLNALEDPVNQIRKTAIVALGRRSDLVVPCQLVETLHPKLWDIDLGVCQGAAIALGRLGQNEAVEPLTTVLFSEHTPESLKLDVAEALGWLQTQTSIEALCNGFEQASSQVRQRIIQTLGKTDDGPLRSISAHFLIGLLTREDWPQLTAGVKQSVALALADLRWSEAFEPLIQLLIDNHAGVRFHGVAALKQLDPDHARHRLQQQLQQETLDETWAQAIRDGLAAW